ncbi:mitotic apparatus p62 protein [Rutstroemia sp. NJR-2017a WRK4]|nr:mitotic apparatus p62 protein [Rutstroemia sp. NJR-2017a WRK4]
MAKDLPAVLRITSGATNENEFVLVHVETAGSKPLDLKLIGTDNESAFTVSFKDSRISSLKAKNSPCSDEEWSSILSSLLLGESTQGAQANVMRGVEVHAKVEDTTMTLVIQKVTEGIKQRLGAIKLTEDANAADEISLFDWCALTIKSSESSKSELESLQIKYKEQQETLDKLNEHFKELNKAKADYETELFEKFALLLNEKKLKIRDQQRLLSCATVDPAKLEAIKSARAGVNRTAGASRSGKRKAAKDAQVESSDDSDSGFEKMDLDDPEPRLAPEPGQDDESDKADQQTPEPSDVEDTATEDEADEPPRAQPQAARKKHVVEDSPDDEQSPPAKPAPKPLPPTRNLPFAKKANPVPAPKPTPAPAPAPVDGSETESDEEL